MNLLSLVVNTDVAWCHLTSSNVPSCNFKSSLFTYFVCFEISWLVKVFPGGKKGLLDLTAFEIRKVMSLCYRI